MKTLVIILVLCAGAAHADDYKPVVCDHAAAYAGAPPHRPPSVAELQVAGALTGALDPATAARLKAAVKRGLAASPSVRSITVSVAIPGEGIWTLERPAPGDPPDALHWWASAGKMFTAVAVLQLADEGKLSLDDPISKWVKGVPNGDAVTLRHLLAHTSGLFSANEDLVVRRDPRRQTLDDRIKVLNRHGAMFCPGERWRYSNTGYDLLGRVIELTDGRPYAQAITARIVAPLGLTRTRILSPGAAVADIAPVMADGKVFDLTEPGAAGAVAAASPDMIRFQQALLGGELLKPQTTADLLAHPYPMFDSGTFYGLGLMLYDVPDPPGTITWIGHSGGAPGVAAVTAWSPRDHAFVAVALTGAGSPPAFGNALLKALIAPAQ